MYDALNVGAVFNSHLFLCLQVTLLSINQPKPAVLILGIDLLQ